MTPEQLAALEALVAQSKTTFHSRSRGGDYWACALCAGPWNDHTVDCLVGGLAAALAEIRALPALLEGLELTTPTELGPMFDVGWTAALRTLKDRLAARAPAAPEGT